MSVTPYYLLGRRQLERVQQQAATALETLVARWWTAPPIVEVRALAFEQLSVDWNKTARYRAATSDGWLALFAPEQSLWTMAEAWLGCHVGHSSDLIKNLEQCFYGELFCALASGSPPPVLETAVPWSRFSTVLKPGAGTVLLEVSIAGLELQFLASPTLWPFLGAVPQRSAAALENATAALGASLVHLEARLPAVRMTLAEVAPLQVGDFVNLHQDLSGRVRLLGLDVDVSLPAELGRRVAKKAVVLS